MSYQAPPSGSIQSQATTAADERSALQKVMWFGILQLVGLVSGWVIAFYVFSTVFTGAFAQNLGANPNPSQVSAALGPMFQAFSLLIPLASVVQLVALVVLILAFRQLKKVDERFSLPSILTIVMLIGSLLAIGGVVPLFNSIPNIIAQAPSTPGVPPTGAFVAAVTSLFAAFILVAVGGIVAFIGLIGGQILGLWRVGSKYDETLLKLGAIFAVIPFLNVVAPILLIVGANQAKNRTGATI